ncbi:MAG: Crp/Fnr family transcriptional regulator [Burkholderiales bacterium]
MSAASSKTQAILSHLPLFNTMTDEELARIVQRTRELNLARGAIVFQKGDPSNGFYLVVHGQVKLALPSANGSEKVVEIINAGQSFGEAVMFMEKPYPVYAQALNDSLLLHIAKAAVFEEIGRDAGFCRKMLAGLSLRLHGLVQDVEAYTLRSSTQRLIGYLLQKDLHGEAENGPATVSLPAGKAVIASRLNLTPETFSRILHNLSSEGLISVDGRNVTVSDVAALRAYDR